MLKKILIICHLFLFAALCFCKNVDESRAINIAKNCISTAKQKSFVFSQIEKQSQGESSFYIVKFNPTGFVIVSGDDRFYPVLFYSTESSYEKNNIPSGFTMMMDSYYEQLNYAVKNYASATDEIKKLWQEYENEQQLFNKIANAKEVLPLIKTRWHQTYPYNKYCPKAISGGSGGRTYAGCVAVALAQLLKYYEKPYTGKGNNTYTLTNYGIVSADFSSTVYNWPNIVNTLQNETDTSKINETAKLIFHSGVAVNTSYGDDISGASFIDAYYALPKYFYFSSSSYLNKNINSNWAPYQEEEWNKLIRDALKLKQPVLYRASDSNGKGNHVFIIDGYNSNDYFHVNWGWGGAFNGYYITNAFSPDNFVFSANNEAIVGVQPLCKYPVINYPVDNQVNFIIGSAISWTDNYPSSSSIYRIKISTDSAMINLKIDTTLYYSNELFIYSLDYDTKYFIKICKGDDWSPIKMFRTEPIDNIAKSDLKCSTPTKGGVVKSLKDYIWYQLLNSSVAMKKILTQVSDDSLFRNVVFKNTNYSRTISNDYSKLKIGVQLKNLEYNKCYYWRIGIIGPDLSNVIVWSDPSFFYTPAGRLTNKNNFPNPFNSETSINFSIFEDGLVTAKIFDYLGREITTLVNEKLKAADYSYKWKPNNLASGIYFCRIKFNDTEKTIKLNFLK